MAYLTRDQVKNVVISSLQTIASLPNDVESSNFDSLNTLQKHFFLSTLKSRLNSLPYYMRDGSTNHLAYYDIDLIPDSTDDWGTVKDCIDFITDSQKVVYL